MAQKISVRRASKAIAVGAILLLSLGATAGPSVAGQQENKGDKSYIAKGDVGLMKANDFPKPKKGELQTFVLDTRTNEAYFLGTGQPWEFEDEADEVAEDIGLDYVPSPQLRIPSPFGCNGLNFCMRRAAPSTTTYGLQGPGTDYGTWNTISYLQTGTYEAVWFDSLGRRAAQSKQTAAYPVPTIDIRQVVQR